MSKHTEAAKKKFTENFEKNIVTQDKTVLMNLFCKTIEFNDIKTNYIEQIMQHPLFDLDASSVLATISAVRSGNIAVLDLLWSKEHLRKQVITTSLDDFRYAPFLIALCNNQIAVMDWLKDKAITLSCADEMIHANKDSAFLYAMALDSLQATYWLVNNTTNKKKYDVMLHSQLHQSLELLLESEDLVFLTTLFSLVRDPEDFAKLCQLTKEYFSKEEGAELFLDTLDELITIAQENQKIIQTLGVSLVFINNSEHVISLIIAQLERLKELYPEYPNIKLLDFLESPQEMLRGAGQALILDDSNFHLQYLLEFGDIVTKLFKETAHKTLQGVEVNREEFYQQLYQRGLGHENLIERDHASPATGQSFVAKLEASRAASALATSAQKL